MTISPTSSTGTAPLVVTTNNPQMNYATMINMLGQRVWDVEIMYMRPLNMNQFSNFPGYQNYSLFGDDAQRMLITVPDTWQYNTSLFLYLEGQNIIFDGNGILSFEMMPGEELQLYLMGKETRINHALAAWHPDNFKSLEDQMGRKGFFRDYTSEI